MLYKVEVRNSQGSLLSLLLDDISDGLIVEDVEGLGPVKATLVSSSFAQQSGVQFHSSSRATRNVILKIGLEPDYATTTATELRAGLYDYFMTESEVSLRFFMSSGLTVETRGRVEDCVPAIFTKEPRMDVFITCFDPDLLGLEEVTIEEETTDDTTEIEVVYDGTTPTGIVFALNVDRSLSEFTIYHRGPDDVVRSFDFAESLIAGDVLTISMIPGDKSVTLLRSSITSSLLNGVSPQANWISLSKGSNYIRVFATGAPIPYEITYLPRYGGL